MIGIRPIDGFNKDSRYSLRVTAPTVTHYGAVTDAKRVGELLRAIDGYEGQGLPYT